MLSRRTLVGFVAAALTLWGVAPAATQHHHHSQPGPSGTPKAEMPSVDLHDDRDGHFLTVLIGPLNVPPRTEHLTLRVPSVMVPLDGWLVAYKPKVVDEKGTTMAQRVIHHVELLNASRPSLICPQLPELLFAAGSELADWPPVPDVGYRVTQGMPLRINLMLTNPTEEPVSDAYVALEIHYRRSAEARLKTVYPVWFMVTHCGPTMYDLQPGRDVKASELTIPYAGRLLAVGGQIGRAHV